MYRANTKSALLRNAGSAFRKVNASSTASHAEEKDAAEVGKGLQKTKLCKFFLSGRCRRGQACTFAHGEEALQQLPDLFKTQLCFQYLEKGSCSYGGSCSFAHSKEELRSIAPGVPCNGGADAISDEDAFSFESESEPLQNKVVSLRSQSGAFEDNEHTHHVSNGCRNCFSIDVANASSSIGVCRNVAYLGFSPVTSAAPMAAHKFFPGAVVMPVAQEQAAPMATVGRKELGQCVWSGMPTLPLCSVLSQQTTEIPSSSGSFGLLEEDDSYTSAASFSTGILEEDLQPEEEHEVETVVIVENTFISLKPMPGSVTKSELSHIRSASAPALTRRS